MAHIRKGDEVVVIAGPGRVSKQRGKVLVVDGKKDRVKVERVNLVKRHVRPSQKHPQGGIVEKEGWVHISNVALWDGKTQSATRVRVKRLEDGRKVRISVKSGEQLD